MRTPAKKMEKSDITAQYLGECFYLDPSTGDLFWLERPEWHFDSRSVMKSTNTKFAGKKAGYPRCMPDGLVRKYVRVGGYNMLFHRVVYAIHNAISISDVPEIIDHINCDTLDNRPINLRSANHKQSVWNRRVQRRSTSGLKGVYYMKRDGVWAASIRANGSRKYLGGFKTKEEAYEAYRQAAVLFHGEFARF